MEVRKPERMGNFSLHLKVVSSGCEFAEFQVAMAAR